jgi:hypothetical protein
MTASESTCPRCGHPGPDPRAQEAGRKGGAARVPKGFAVRRVLWKALATRRENARIRKEELAKG